MSARRRGGLLSVIAGLVAACGAPAIADGDAVAVVNGHPIPRAALVDALIDAYGVEMLSQLIVLEAARRETARQGLRVTAADVERELRESIERIAREAGIEPKPGNEAEQAEALNAMLAQKRISDAEFRLSMERNAHLRKLVERELKIDDDTLREEFARTYGERVIVRHIQVEADDSRLLNDVVTRVSNGEDFAEVARRFSQNAQSAPLGGRMEPFSFEDEQIPAALREVAFALRPGEVSTPVRAGRMVHVLKLEQRIAPDHARFEDVRTEVERRLRERVLPQRMAEAASELYRKANVSVIDARLRERYEAFRKQTEGGG